jgi:hypothetical protein
VIDGQTIGWQIKHHPGSLQIVVAPEPDDAQGSVRRRGAARVGRPYDLGRAWPARLIPRPFRLEPRGVGWLRRYGAERRIPSSITGLNLGLDTSSLACIRTAARYR